MDSSAGDLSSPTSYDPMAAARNMASGLGNAMSVNASQILAQQQRHKIQVMATATSSVSITAALCAMYWFCMMRRNFRRDLILLLIAGDFWKSSWYLIYAVVTFVHGQLQTHTPFCQAGGYMLQVGLESCDMAIFLMSLHMCLQIFPPASSYLGHDGLYRVRYLVLALWIIVPNANAALAFVNPGPAYQAAGAFCTLPIRPYWYRLALSWIPRYLIWIFIMGVAIRIYMHAGREFKVFGHGRDRSSSMNTPGESSVNRAMATEAIASLGRKSTAPVAPDEMKAGEDDDLAPEDVSASQGGKEAKRKESPPESTTSVLNGALRQPSAPRWSAGFGFANETVSGSHSVKSAPASRRGSTQTAAGVMAEDFTPTPPPLIDQRHLGSIATLASVCSSVAPSFHSIPGLPPIVEDKRSLASAVSHHTTNLAAKVVRDRRLAIQRQLRLLFIYPVTYSIIWIVPFIFHCFNYNNYYAQHPIFALSAVNTFCQCFLGFADVSIFCWREKPWRHVPGSDGTFLGSFCWWRFWRESEWARRQSAAAMSEIPPDDEEEDEKPTMRGIQGGLLGTVKRWSIHSDKATSNSPRHSQGSGSVSAAGGPRRPVAHRRISSGGSDRKNLEIERAHERLALERADWQANRKSFEKRRASLMGVPPQQGSGTTAPAQSGERKEWWDTELENVVAGEGGGEVEIKS